MIQISYYIRNNSHLGTHPIFVVAWNGPHVTVLGKVARIGNRALKSSQYDCADTHALSRELASALIHILAVLSVLHPCTVYVNPVPKQLRIVYSDASVEPDTVPRLGWVCIYERGHIALGSYIGSR